MVVVRNCNVCGKEFDSDFMAEAYCGCNSPQKNIKGRNKHQKRVGKWDNVKISTLPTGSNKRSMETDAILSVFNQ